MKSKRYQITASEGSRVLVEVRLSRTQREMVAEARRLDGGALTLSRRRKHGGTEGACRSWSIRGKDSYGVTMPKQGRRIVARVYLNKQFLGTNVFTHELGHAAMAYARLRRADLGKMPGEEVMCYALGHMCAQLGDLFHRIGAWR